MAKLACPYHSKYHFLEGLVNYNEIGDNIDFAKRNREIVINKVDEFENKETFLVDLEQLILMHQNSNIVISYRNNGLPSIQQIEDLIVMCKPLHRHYTLDLGTYGYALNKTNDINNEFLIISTNQLIENQ